MCDPYAVLTGLNYYNSTGTGDAVLDAGVRNARNPIAHRGEVGAQYTTEQVQRLTSAGAALVAQAAAVSSSASGSSGSSGSGTGRK